MEYVSQYPPAYTSDYVKATTSYYNEHYWPYYATDPSKALTGSWEYQQWLSLDGPPTIADQRFHIDLGSAKVIQRLYYENGHYIGSYTEAGVRDFTLWGSNDSADFNDLTYANDGTWEQVGVNIRFE